jgi:hypothetical protein
MATKTLENVTVSDAYLALMADRGVEPRRARCCLCWSVR